MTDDDIYLKIRDLPEPPMLWHGLEPEYYCDVRTTSSVLKEMNKKTDWIRQFAKKHNVEHMLNDERKPMTDKDTQIEPTEADLKATVDVVFSDEFSSDPSTAVAIAIAKVRIDEREACAAEVDNYCEFLSDFIDLDIPTTTTDAWISVLNTAADKIRARGSAINSDDCKHTWEHRQDVSTGSFDECTLCGETKS